MIRKVLVGFLLLLVILIIWYWNLLIYGVQQAKGQLSITMNTRPVLEVMLDSTVADSIKQKIQLVQKARIFAYEKLGLKKNTNYTTYYDQKEDVLLWNLSASKPYALEPKLWSFPILGSFPYKGFFDPQKAREEMRILQSEGYDTRIRPVGGWSTLGWTSDPILSDMLERPEGALVELIIHELTHATLFVKNNIEFNENLASFIGEKGAIQYLREKYGENAVELIDYILTKEDSKTFRNQMLAAAQKLDSLYKSIVYLPDSVKASQKHTMIDSIIASIDTLHFHDPRYYRVFDTHKPNNAYFMSFLRYYSAKDSLDKILSNSYENNLKLFILDMKEYDQ